MDRQQNFVDDYNGEVTPFSRVERNGPKAEPEYCSDKCTRGNGISNELQNGNRSAPENADDQEGGRRRRDARNMTKNGVHRRGPNVASGGVFAAKHDRSSRAPVEDIETFSARNFATKVRLSEQEFLDLPAKEAIEILSSVDNGKAKPTASKARAHAAVAWLFHDKERLQYTRPILSAVRLRNLVPDTRRAIRQSEALMVAYTSDELSNGVNGCAEVEKDVNDGEKEPKSKQQDGRALRNKARRDRHASKQQQRTTPAATNTNGEAPEYHGNQPVTLMQDVRAMLNRLSSESFGVIQERFRNLEITSSQEVKEIVAELVKTGIDRWNSATLYAELTKSLASGNDVIDGDEDNKKAGEDGEESASQNIARNVLVEQTLMASFAAEIQKLFEKGLRIGGPPPNDENISPKETAEKRRRELQLHRRYLALIRFVGELYLVGLTGVDIVTNLMVELLPKPDVDYNSTQKCSLKIQHELDALCMLILRVGDRISSEDNKSLNDESLGILDALRDIVEKKAASDYLLQMMQAILDPSGLPLKNDAVDNMPPKQQEKSDEIVLPSTAPVRSAADTTKKPARRAREKAQVDSRRRQDRPARVSVYRSTAAPWRRVSERPAQSSEIAKKFTALRILLNKLVPDNVAAFAKEFSNLDLCFRDEVLSAANTLENRMRRDPLYSPLYARMMRTLLVRPNYSSKKAAGAGGGGGESGDVTAEARKQLLQTLQSEFEDKIAKIGDSFALWTPMRQKLELFWPGLVYFQWRAQRARLTTMRLIGELFVQKLVPRAIIVHCIQQLLPKNHAADLQFFNLSPRAQIKLDCLCMLLMTICMRTNEASITQELMQSKPLNLLEQLNAMVDAEKQIMPMRLKYRVQDVIDIATTGSAADAGGIVKVERGSGDEAGKENVDLRTACFADVYIEYHRRRVESKIAVNQPSLLDVQLEKDGDDMLNAHDESVV